MPKTKTSTVKSKSSKSSNKLVRVGKLKFDKTLLIVTMAVLAVGAGWLWYKGSHAASGVSGAVVPRSYICYSPHPAIQQGSTGDCVRYVQWTLKTYAGQNIAVDGNYGPATAQAVKNLQAINGLATSGAMDAITWERLDKLIQPGNVGNSIGADRSACKDLKVYGISPAGVYVPNKIAKNGSSLQIRATFKNMGTHTWPNPGARVRIFNTSGQILASLSDYLPMEGSNITPGHTITTQGSTSYPFSFNHSPGMYIVNVQVLASLAYGDNYYFGPECTAPLFVTN